MAYVDWRITGPELTTCNCDWGCPCQFNARPTRGDCRAAVAMRIDRGHFGEVSLNGLHWAAVFAWPKAIHEGNGEVLAIVDERADEGQREAILKILTGQETEPGATIFNVFAATFTTIHQPVFAAIEFEADIAAGKGRFQVTNLVEATVEPMRNPVTGAPHRVHVQLPHGFEYHNAEYASSTTRAGPPIPQDWSDRYAHLTFLDMTPYGPRQ
jgi:hypothetical protein